MFFLRIARNPKIKKTAEAQTPFAPLRSGPKAASKPSRQKKIPSSLAANYNFGNVDTEVDGLDASDDWEFF